MGAKLLKKLFCTVCQPGIDFQTVRDFSCLSFLFVFIVVHIFKLVEQPVILCESEIITDAFRNVPANHQGIVKDGNDLLAFPLV